MRLARLAVLFLLLLPTASQALFRTYLSVNGSDANDCSRATPCRLLPAALATVDDGGEIWMLDSANFNTGPVFVAKSVTILAIPGALGSVVAAGSPGAIVIDGPGVKVTLRNLSVGKFSGSNGVRFVQGASLLIENCRIFGNDGIGLQAFAAGSKLTVRDSVIRGNFFGAMLEQDMSATFDRVQVIDNANDGIQAQPGVKLLVQDSVVAGNGSIGIFANGAYAGTLRVTVDRTILARNFSPGFYAVANAPGAVTMASISRSSISSNGAFGVASAISNGGISTVLLDASAISHQAQGTFATGLTATIESRQNNTFTYVTLPGNAAYVPVTGQ